MGSREPGREAGCDLTRVCSSREARPCLTPLPYHREKSVAERFELFADYFQFYLQDEAAAGDLSESWDPEAVDRLLALAPGTIGVGTVRNTTVPVEVEIAQQAPSGDLDGWDRVNECSIALLQGASSLPAAPIISLRPSGSSSSRGPTGLGSTTVG